MSARILAVAFEPPETRILSKLMARLSGRHFLLAADTYQLWNDPHALEALAEEHNVSLLTLAGVFESWQGSSRDAGPLDYNRLRIRNWMERNSPSRSLQQLVRTDHVLHPWERAPYYRYLSGAWKIRIVADIMETVEQGLEVSKPDLVLMLGNDYLVKSLVFEVCQAKGIRVLSMIHSRISDLFLPRFDFGMGCGEVTGRSIELGVRDELAVRKARDLMATWRQEVTEEAAYTGASWSAQQRMGGNFSTALSSEVSSLKRTLKVAVKQFKRGNILGFRYASSPILGVQFDALRLGRIAFRRAVSSLSRSQDGPAPISGRPYVYWPLHARPESSVSTLGLGRDEFAEIRNLLDMLPHGIAMVIKENPLMVADRRIGKLGRLARDPRVVLAPATASSTRLAAGAVATIGLSGTALLETALMGRPSYAVGEPEFISAVYSRNDMSIGTFLKMSAEGLLSSRDAELERYLSFVYHFGVPALDLDATDSTKWEAWTEFIESLLARH